MIPVNIYPCVYVLHVACIYTQDTMCCGTSRICVNNDLHSKYLHLTHKNICDTMCGMSRMCEVVVEQYHSIAWLYYTLDTTVI